MKNKYLLLTFLIFAVGFLATQFYFEGQPRTLQTTLIQLDTNQITSLLIYPSVDNQEEYLLKKEDGFWVVHKNEVTLRVSAEYTQQFLENLADIRTKGVVARHSDDWSNYNIDKGKATKIKVFEGTNLLDEFYVNRIDTRNTANPNISYVRLLTGGEVYEVVGPLSRLFSKGFKAYRNTTILKTNISTIENITITQEDRSTILSQKDSIWTQDDLPIDTITLDNYLTGLTLINSENFADDFDLVESSDLLHKTLTIQKNADDTPIIIRAYLDSTRATPYIIQSNQNEGSFFASGENGVFEQIFGGW